MPLEHWLNDTDGKNKVLGAKSLQGLLCVPQIPHGLLLD